MSNHGHPNDAFGEGPRRLRRTLGASAVGLLLAFAALQATGCKPAPAAEPTLPSTPAKETLPLAPKKLDVELLAPQPSAPFDPEATILKTELTRTYAELGQVDPPPYFLGYYMVDRETLHISASDGALVESTSDRERTLDVDLRIGTPERDHTHDLPGEESSGFFSTLHRVALDGAEAALKNTLWLATDQEYDAAKARWLRVQGADEDEKESRADFTLRKPVVHAEPRPDMGVERTVWEQRLRRLSAVALDYPEIQRSGVALSVAAETRHLVNTEGTQLQLGVAALRLELQVQTVAADGMVLNRFDSIDVRSSQGLPDDATLKARFQALFEDVQALQEAEVIEPYVGPAILDGRAAGVFFHEVLGHRLEGHRQDAEHEGQTFANMVGQTVMHPTLTIYDDPRVRRLNGVELNGFYLFDDEGVPAQRASLVQDGVLQGFLLSRSPAGGFSASNGHGRREPGYAVVARQANLIVDPKRTVSRETLERALLDEVGAQGLPYVLRFSEISGGFTQTQRYDTQAFKVIPVMVYKVFPDGRQELVRGVDIEGTPLTALSKIVAAANDFEVFNGMCGAESGWVPVSATSPSVLLSQIEVARQEQHDEKPPLLPPPGGTPPVQAPSAAPPSAAPPPTAPTTTGVEP